MMRLAILVGAVLVGGLVAAAVVTARGGPTASDALELAIASEPLVKVTDLPSADGVEARGLFIQRTSVGYLCVWDAPNEKSKLRQGQCNPTDDLFGDRAVFASLAYEGGPAIEAVKDARLVGVVPAGAAGVAVLMSHASRRELKLKRLSGGTSDIRAFGYRFKKADLKRGIGPTAIVAYDAAGNELGRQPTGIG